MNTRQNTIQEAHDHGTDSRANEENAKDILFELKTSKLSFGGKLQQLDVMAKHGLTDQNAKMKACQLFFSSLTVTSVPSLRSFKVQSIRHPIQERVEITSGSHVKFRDGAFIEYNQLRLKALPQS